MSYCRHVVISILIFSAAYAAYAQSTFVAAAATQCLAPSYTGNAISLYDLDARCIRNLYHDTDIFFSQREIKRSPDGRYIAAIGTLNSILTNERGINYLKRSLIVVDTGSTVIGKIEGCQLFDWSPDSRTIAVVRGAYFSDKDAPATDSLSMFDLHSRRESFVATTRATDIHWAGFDGNIYLEEGDRVSVIEPKTRKKHLTQYRDIHFSPDGRYYLFMRTLPGTSRLFDGQTNKDITPSFLLQRSFDFNYFRWLDGETIVVGDLTFEKKIFSIPSATIRRTLTGFILYYDNQRRELLIRKDNSNLKERPGVRLERVHVDPR